MSDGGDVFYSGAATGPCCAGPGPGGLTPLHLAAALPAWFSVAARDGCTPAHYASRAGNSHLNDHALLCLALGLGTAALDVELGAAAGGAGRGTEGAGVGAGGQGQWGTSSVMQQHEQPQRVSSNNGDDAGSDSSSRTLETSLSFNRDDTDADGDAGASHAARRSDQQPQPQDPPPGHRRVLASLVAGAAAAGSAAAGPRAAGAEDADFGFGVRNRRRGDQEERLANLRTAWNWRGERSLATAAAFGAPPVTGSASTPAAPGAATGVGAASPVPGVAGADGYMTYTTAAAAAASTAFTAAGAAAAESESWWSEPWGSNARRTWPDPNTIISGLLERVSPVASAHGSFSPATSPWRSPSTTPVPSNSANNTSAPAAGLGGHTRASRSNVLQPGPPLHASPGHHGRGSQGSNRHVDAAVDALCASSLLQHLALRGVMTGVAPGAAAWTAAAVVVAAMLLPQLQALASDVLPRLLGSGGATTALVALMALVAARLMPRRLGAAREVPN
eukprot:XP_001695714.1 predicted protein [Chlamydomonas reinhardtii]